MVNTAIAEPGIVKYTPNMTVKSLVGRSDTDLVELKNGRHISVGDLRRLDAAQQSLAKLRRMARIRLSILSAHGQRKCMRATSITRIILVHSL
jgi:hypothetical protein